MAQKQERKKSSGFIVSILLIVVVIVLFFVCESYFKGKDDGERESQQEIALLEEHENNTSNEDNENVAEKEIIQYDGNDPNEAENISGVITYADINGDSLSIRVNIDQFLNSGDCVLELKQDGTTVYRSTARVVENVTTTTCEGFDIPKNSINEGMTDIMIMVKSGEKTGIITGGVKL